jgi:hypothetical protein
MAEICIAAERDLEATERSGAAAATGMRTLWQLDGGMPTAMARQRRALAASLHNLLAGWRAAEREVAQLTADGVTEPPPAAASVLLESIDRYRADHHRIFDAIRGLATAEEHAPSAWWQDVDGPLEIH